MEIKVPNIGDASGVEVIEILVAPGDKVKQEDSLITVESEKASMEIPSPAAGTIQNIKVKVGDKVSEGSVILTLEPSESKPEELKTKEKETPDSKEKPSPNAVTKETTPEKKTSQVSVKIPDIGDAKNVTVIEILVKPGSDVKKDDSLITLEGEKATMEIPSPYSGKVEDIKLKVGDKVSEGDEMLTMLAVDSSEIEKDKVVSPPVAEKKETIEQKERSPAREQETSVKTISSAIYAGPAVRRIAREFGVDLTKISGSGPKHRILKEDVQNYVKTALSQSSSGGINLGKMPEIDFSKYGPVEKVILSKIKKLTGVNVHRSWINIPHVTQFDSADITDLEEFRKSQKHLAEEKAVKLTPLVFIMKAVVAALKEYPPFNSSLDATGENIIIKKYFNLGIAVDTPNGLVVPVVKNVDQKNMFELAQELGDISKKAREKGLSPADMSGSCFTISSLGGIGGTAFTPIINAPDVAILGVSKADIKPVYKHGAFIPRLMLPLSLSYDHRVIDGADGARFLVYLASRLADIRTLLL